MRSPRAQREGNNKWQKLSLEKVTIDGFRGLRNLTLDGLGRVNLLVGANNSGKTSVIEALSILCSPRDPFEWLAMVRRRDFGGLDETRIQSLRWCFRQTGELSDPEFQFRGQCDLACSGRFHVDSLHVEYEDMIGEPSSRELERLLRRRAGTGYPPDEGWSGARISHFVESVLPAADSKAGASASKFSIEEFAIQVWEEDPMIGRPYRPRRPDNLPSETLTPYSYQLNTMQVRSQSRQLFQPLGTPSEARDFVLEVVKEFDSEIVDIGIASFRGGRAAIYLDHKRLGPAPLSIYGDALRRVVLLANTLQQLKGGGVVLIDEVETGIHVSALERVFAWLSRAAGQLDVQVIATTHSLEAVDAIADSMADKVDDLVTFNLDQTPEQTKIKRIDGDMLVRLRRERGLDVR